MNSYDAMTPPDAEEWLELDEQERIELVRQRHRRAKMKLPRSELHAMFHAVVETQVAMGDELPARRTLARLMKEGLDRHEAIHAIGSVLAEHMHTILKAPQAGVDHNRAFWAAVEKLEAESWRRSFDE